MQAETLITESMKRLIIIMALVLFGVTGLVAQTYLSEKFKPIDERKYYPHYPTVKGQSDDMSIAVYKYTNGFTLWNGVTNDQAKQNAYVVFSLKGAYEKISFVMGPDSPNPANDQSADIIVVRADGKRILDEVMHDYDAPREIVLDVNGVDELRFDLWSGLVGACFGEARLWKAGEKHTPAPDPLASVNAPDRVKLVEELYPHYICHRGWSAPITKQDHSGIAETESIKINRVTYDSGIEFSASQEFGEGISSGFAYFWLQKKFDKVSFIVGPRDNQSSNAAGWFVVKADGKIIYEELISQTDLAQVVVLDVPDVNILSMHSGELEKSDFLGGMTFGVVNIYAYKKGYADIPTPGRANASQARLSKLPDVVKMCSNIEPFSIRGISTFDRTFFDGTSSHYHFSMGGEQFDEGFILATGTKLFFDDNIGAYYRFDLAQEFDWVSFKVGTLTKHRVLDDDVIRVYADDKVILETTIHATWPNQEFTLPLNKCQTLTFSKPGTGKQDQTYFGFGDIVLYRGKPVPNDLFEHPKPDCPETADLIDLCKAPYFHYVGRYLSTLTNFDFNDCFKNGSTKREYFQMKDGTKIYKGVMLETNIPLALEDITVTDATFMFLTGVGGAIGHSDVSAATGVSSGAGLAGAAGVLNLIGEGRKQSSVVAFNPYKEYESCTFTVANKSEYSEDDMFGKKKPDEPVHLYVFADRYLVGDFWLTNKMEPTTYTVPINKCEQLMFWLECGESRSGQYVLYDMTVSKKPYVAPESTKPTPKPQKSALESSKSTQEIPSVEETPTEAPDESPKESPKEKKSFFKKSKDAVVWDFNGESCGQESTDAFLEEVTSIWNATEELKEKLDTDYSLSTDERRSSILEVINEAKDIQTRAGLAKISSTSASLDLLNITSFDERSYYSKYVKLGSKVLKQCISEAKQVVEMKNAELNSL